MLASLLGMLVSKGPYIIIAIVLLLILIKVLKKVSAVRAKKKEIRQAAADRARDENLNSYILNSHSTVDNKAAYVPYEVDYSQGREEGTTQQLKNLDSKATMIQIVEKTELSTRKFVLNASKGIKIGTASDNDISFFSGDQSAYQCEIFAVRGRAFVRNLIAGSRIYIRRKKDQAIVDNKGIELRNNDNIIVGNYIYEITIIK